MARIISVRLYVDWAFTNNYSDESQYLISAEGDMRLAPPGARSVAAQGIVSSAMLTLRNANGRFSPLRTDSPLYSAIQNGRAYHAPCYLEASIDGGANYARIFTGVLKLPQEQTLTLTDSPTIRIEARSMEEKFLQRRLSLGQSQMAAIYDGGLTESSIISTFLQVAGVSGGDMQLDPGLFIVPWAWLDDESPIEECWALAAACGGRFYANPTGKFCYENLAHWQTAARSTTVQLSLTRDSLDSFSLRLDDADLYNVVEVEASPRTPSGVDVIWEPETSPVIAPNASQTVLARYDAPAYIISGLQWAASDQGGNNRSADVTLTQATYYAQRAELTFTNASSMQIILYPLRILGVPIVGGPEISERRTSATNGSNAAFWSGRGDRTLSLRGNTYIQTPAHAATLAQFLLDRCEYPRLIANAGLPGDPTLRLGDRVQITDAPTMSGIFTGYITAIHWQFSGGAFDQDIELVQASQLFAYDGNYFRLGTDTFSASKRMFY